MNRQSALTLLEVLVVVTILAIVMIISIPSMIAAKKHANEGAAVAALKVIQSEQTFYREKDLDQNGLNDYGTLNQLSTAGVLDAILGTGSKQGYRFQAGPSTITSENLWFALANPAIPGSTGDRYFMTNHTGVIYFTSGVAPALNTTDCKMPAGSTPVN